MGIFDYDKDLKITSDVTESFNKNGFLILKNFLSKSEISPLQQQLHDLSFAIEHKNSGLNSINPGYDDIDKHLLRLLNKGIIKQPLLYDRMQQIPGLLALPSNHKIQLLAQEILKSPYLGIWPRIQLRFDIHGDQWNVINWHHDYLYNRGTEASITFWIPIVKITKKMGPIKIASGSHLQDFSFIETKNAKFNFTLSDQQVAKLQVVDHDEFNPGDVCILHSKTIHTGCLNEEIERARLTCIFRMQDLTQLEIN